MIKSLADLEDNKLPSSKPREETGNTNKQPPPSSQNRPWTFLRNVPSHIPDGMEQTSQDGPYPLAGGASGQSKPKGVVAPMGRPPGQWGTHWPGRTQVAPRPGRAGPGQGSCRSHRPAVKCGIMGRAQGARGTRPHGRTTAPGGRGRARAGPRTLGRTWPGPGRTRRPHQYTNGTVLVNRDALLVQYSSTVLYSYS